MGQNRCFQYNGKYYDVGTKVRMKFKNEELITTYLGGDDRYAYKFEGLPPNMFNGGSHPQNRIIEIIDPVYPQAPNIDKSKRANIFFRTGSGSAESADNVFHGFLLYLAVMIIGTFFNARLLIWIIATITYFGWKSRL